MGFTVTHVQKALRGADYPMDGAELSELARRNGAGDELASILRRLPRVDGPTAVMAQLEDQLGATGGPQERGGFA